MPQADSFIGVGKWLFSVVSVTFLQEVLDTGWGLKRETGLPSEDRKPRLGNRNDLGLCFSGFQKFVHIGINDSYGGDVYDIAHGAFEVCEVDGFVQSHLYRTYDLNIRIQCL